MSDVKLFRVTEFAQSTFPSPLAHRQSIHPLWVMLIVAAWVATAGHWPLWQMFVQGDSQVSPGLMAAFALQWAAASLVLMALACWRWTFKPALVLLLVWVALGACQMVRLADSGQAMAVSPAALLAVLLKQDTWRLLLNWKCLLTLGQVAVIPAVMLALWQVRRIPFQQNLVVNALLLVVAYVLLVSTRAYIGHAMPSVLDLLPIF